MVFVKKRKQGSKEYYYLEHSERIGNKVMKKEKYIGDKLPQNINELKAEFAADLIRNKWLSLIDKIKINHSIEKKKMPLIALDKAKEDFAVRFTYNTQRIEGSTLTLSETADLLIDGITPNAKPLSDVKEAEIHKKVFLEMLEYKGDLSLNKILKWHNELFNETKKEIAGKIREHNVMISASKFVPPQPVIIKKLLDEFFKWHLNNKNKIHPVELAGLVHLKFVTIHPFSDGNGRLSRLIMNYALSINDYPLFDIKYENRKGYYKSLEKSQVKKEDLSFIKWFLKNYANQHKKYLATK